MARELLHYGIHFILPLAIGLIAYPHYQWKAVLILPIRSEDLLHALDYGTGDGDPGF